MSFVQKTQRWPVGRYTDISRASGAGCDLPRPGAHRLGVEIRHAAVDDPNPAFSGKRQRAAINIRVDALENEYARGRITEAAYRAGRHYQQVLERAAKGLALPIWSDAGFKRKPGDSYLIAQLERAKDVETMRLETRPLIGKGYEQILNAILRDGKTLTECSTLLGNGKRQALSYVAIAFRDAVEILGNEWNYY